MKTRAILILAVVALTLQSTGVALGDVHRADSVMAPDEENFLDIVTLGVPQLLPTVLDVGELNSTVEQSIPDLIDVWPSTGVGVCSLDAEQPHLSRTNLTVGSSATYSCSTQQRQMSIGVH